MPSHVHDDSLIHTVGAMQIVEAQLSGQIRGSVLSINKPPMIKDYYGDKVDLFMLDLRKKVTCSINDMWYVNTGASSFQHRYMDNFLYVA